MYYHVLFFIYLAILLLMSLVSFILFGKDKQYAKNRTIEKRIPEKILLAFTAFGGGIGALIGRLIFRHKTTKIYFSFLIFLSFVLQIAVLILLFSQMLLHPLPVL